MREAFFDVNAAQQDAVRVQNEAGTFASRVVPRRAARRPADPAGRGLPRAGRPPRRLGQAARFSQVYDEYRQAPDVIRERIFLETMERVLGGMDKIIIDQSGQQGVVPYLPLNELQRRPPPPSGRRHQAQAGATR